MRTVCILMLCCLLAGCSSSEKPAQKPPLTEADLSAMPRISLQEVAAKLKGPLEKPLVIALWRAKMKDADAAAFLNELSAFAERHGGLDVLVLNIDFPAQLRDAVALMGAMKPKFQARSFQGDRMGLGVQVGWGGEPVPLVALFGSDGKRAATARGKDALAQVAAKLSQVR